MEKVSNIIIKVQQRLPGNVIKHIPVEFEVYKDGSYFQAVPLCSEDIKRITDLPDKLSIELNNGKAFRLKREKEQLVDDIVERLTQMQEV